MSDFIIHTFAGSPFGRTVLVALEEKRAPYRVVAVTPGQHRAPEHLALHPFGRVPVLDHGGFKLYETQAILRYLDRVCPIPALTPADPQEAGRMDQIMNINDWYLFQGVSNVIGFQRIVAPRLMGTTPDEALIAAAMPKARAVFVELARSLGDRQFFAGNMLSLADLLLAPQFDFLRATPEWRPLSAEHPNLEAWLERMNARPSMAATTWERVSAMAAAQKRDTTD